MDLTLTKRGDYAVRGAIALGRAYGTGGFRKIREVAEDMDIPPTYTAQILNLLLKAGLAGARAGRQGGYRLLKAPAEISLLEIVEAAEGPLRPKRCTLSGGPCRWEKMCAVHPIWEELHTGLARILAERSLASVLAVDEKLEAGDYTVAGTSHRLEATQT